MLLTFSLRMAIDFSLDQLTKTFIGISNPPWNKGDGLHLSDITMHTTYIYSILAEYVQPLHDLFFKVSWLEIANLS